MKDMQLPLRGHQVEEQQTVMVLVISFKSPVYLKCLSQCGPISNPQLVLDSAADAVRSPPDRPREATLY